MGTGSVRRLSGLSIVFLALLLVRVPAGAQQHASGCAYGRAVCMMQAHTVYAACLRGCPMRNARCHALCMTASRPARATCAASGADCLMTCAGSAASCASCDVRCSKPARACFADALAAGAQCVGGCRAASGAGLQSCLDQCAVTIGGIRATCLADLQGCLVGCQGQVTGGCFSTIAMECTAEACRPDQPCSEPSEFCSERCSAPPESGTCLDLGTLRCTGQTCSPAAPCAKPDQTCVPVCPPPIPQGRCFDPKAEECTDQVCDPTHQCAGANQICTLQCPQRTPVAPCSDASCEGPCVISPTCPPGHVCPEAAFVARVGVCTSDAAGNCGCVPVSPPPTTTPQATPTPQCRERPCGGPCRVSVPFPCPPGQICNGPNIPVEEGECTADAAGNCDCVPLSPPPTATPQSTPTPQCSERPCGGPCRISVPFPCPGSDLCNGPNVPVEDGQCTASANGGCDCVRVRPTSHATSTPRATPTPQCAGPVCGGECVISPHCPPNGPCPEYPSRPGQCAPDVAGSCQCIPVEPPTPTPECATDADCDDVNSCTADRCVHGICDHECLCLGAAGERTCCPGPSAVCVAPCGGDAAGVCGGSCPTGAQCETSPSANGACGCVSGPGGPCGGNIFAPPPVCAPGLVCHQTLPDVTGYCETPDCVPLFTAGCSQTSDCCEPCGNGTHAPCGVCINGTCEGAP